MLAFLVLLAFHPANGYRDYLETGRIHGGEPADITEMPFIISLHESFGEPEVPNFCSASILTERWALTAAHCLKKATDAWARAGTNNLLVGGTSHKVIKLVIHKDSNKIRIVDFVKHTYTEYTLNDIAVLKVDPPFPLNGVTVRAARLPDQDLKIPSGSLATVAGWGMLGPGEDTSIILQKIEVHILDGSECFTPLTETFFSDEKNICTAEEKKMACPGDSGGPLFVDGMVLGVLSWGSACVNIYGPDIFTRVSYFRDFIEQTIQE